MSGKARRTWGRAGGQRGLKAKSPMHVLYPPVQCVQITSYTYARAHTRTTTGLLSALPTALSSPSPTCCRKSSLYARPSAVWTMNGMCTACGACPAANSSCVLQRRRGGGGAAALATQRLCRPVCRTAADTKKLLTAADREADEPQRMLSRQSARENPRLPPQRSTTL